MTNSNIDTLLIIGNGFDLSCGLKSSFADFFETNLGQIRKFIFSREWPVKINIWYLFLYFTFYDKQDEEGRIFEKIDKSELLWMDVESLIKAVVSYNEKSFYLLDDFTKQYGNYLNLLNHIFKDCLQISSGTYDQITTLKKFFKQFYFNSKVFNFYDELYKGFNSFKTEFKNYLVECLNKTTDYVANASQILNKIISSNESFSLISFNYTTPFKDKVNESLLCNIHGTIDDDIVIGFDASKSEELNKDDIKFSKSWQKMTLGFPKYKLPPKKYVEKIKFYGHSLGEQDYAYFHALFDYYDLYNGDLILEFYYSEYGKSEEENKEIRNRYQTSINKLLFDYSINSGKESKVRTIVSKLQIENRLRIKSI